VLQKPCYWQYPNNARAGLNLLRAVLGRRAVVCHPWPRNILWYRSTKESKKEKKEGKEDTKKWFIFVVIFQIFL
jgi:hypothetical protein